MKLLEQRLDEYYMSKTCFGLKIQTYSLKKA
jgi:hypothetical protein